MNARAGLALAGLLALSRSARAELSQERRDYILAHPHGWVELAVVDRAIPEVPSRDEEHPGLVRPVSCAFRVEIGGETFVHGAVYPVGSAAPYTAKTGFRFPAPAGASRLRLAYSGCDVEGGKLATVEVEVRIVVEENRIVALEFDGTRVAVKRSAAPSR